jgi:hypothetical protein
MVTVLVPPVDDKAFIPVTAWIAPVHALIAELIAVATAAVVVPVPNVFPVDWALPQALFPLPPVTPPVKVNVAMSELVRDPPTVVPPLMVPVAVPEV